jgi:hypothetical protein
MPYVYRYGEELPDRLPIALADAIVAGPAPARLVFLVVVAGAGEPARF